MRKPTILTLPNPSETGGYISMTTGEFIRQHMKKLDMSNKELHQAMRHYGACFDSVNYISALRYDALLPKELIEPLLRAFGYTEGELIELGQRFMVALDDQIARWFDSPEDSARHRIRDKALALVRPA